MSYGVMKVSTEISKETLGGQAMCLGLESLHAGPVRKMCEAVKVKLKMQWRSQEHGTSLKKATGNNHCQSKRGHVGCSYQGHRGGAAQACSACIPPPCCC
jgi:hypothetical protein